ncbi:hypothetical protein [Streptomyces sp. CAU 1734]|uniref:hypothetical protein n=1 Tax=Streptomyces sp. CAU 1734 TaxID=3140360 RepID=UPI003261703C
MTEDSDPQEETTQKATVQPAAPWPVYNVDRAHAELLAMEMLTRGASYLKVRHATRLSPKNVRRLQKLVSEEAKSPSAPRIVCRTEPRPRRITWTPQPAPAQTGRPQEPAESVQMTLSFDC